MTEKKQSNTFFTLIIVLVALFLFGLLCVWVTTPSALKDSDIPSQTSKSSVEETNKQEVDDSKKAFRRRTVLDSRPKLEKGGTKISLIGDDEDVMKLEASRLSDFELLNILKDSFKGFRDMGFSKIIIIDKDMKEREVNLTILD